MAGDDLSLDATGLMLLAVLRPHYQSSHLLVAMAVDRMKDERDDARDERDDAVAARDESLARARQAKHALETLRAEFTESRYASRQRELARITTEGDDLHARIAALEAKKLAMTMEIAAVRRKYEPRLEAVRAALRGASAPPSTSDTPPRRDAPEPSSTEGAEEERAEIVPSRVSDDDGASSIDDEEHRRPLKRCRIVPNSTVNV
ncbi:hypothetical protein SDRG_15627 [Saprolegnia diclina VS20]|uniref:Uncharacterized protein n=1 Tax=Saprolegnia diclina (strain VS20) TaxID=1156394 RepID=T0PZM0_SAPDV|nr:hypothetical protein SDRG_15627 [Saprolegnia diclina VS20]EQC26535.1 hypothetical protein SDRG_15627 [Saprolegnia diclina VS20]|eukprot:XP_008620028.1 hypothetical protein SDRG_15627 [Saprolegnia diclina VS20]